MSTCTNFSCFQLFIPEERKKKGFSRVLIFANQSYQKYFAGANFREFGSKNAKFAKISTPKVHNKQRNHSPATNFLNSFFYYIITKFNTMGSLCRSGSPKLI